jgi:hypothetical protein
MPTYPQLRTGALSQFPVRTERRARTVVNAAPDGSAIKLADAAGAVTEWTLAYAGLTDAELGALEGFFALAEGSLNGFTFLHPAANLLAWSGDLSQPAWVLDPALAVASGIEDPMGGTAAFALTNSGAAAQGISQTLAAPGAYVYSFSAYVRAQTAGTATMTIGANQAARPVGMQWSRVVFSATGDATAQEVCFGLQIPAGAQLDVYGMQAEPQPAASAYQPSTNGGVYQNARLGGDQLAVKTTGVGRHSCTVNIVYANHL